MSNVNKRNLSPKTPSKKRSKAALSTKNTQSRLLPPESNLPPELLNLIYRMHTLSTQNIAAMRSVHSNLKRNVPERNTNKAATKIAAHARGKKAREFVAMLYNLQEMLDEI